MNEDLFYSKELFRRPFDVINLPSEGRFYSNGKSSLKIRYLTGLEERILSSYFLSQSGESIRLVLKNLILEDDFDVDNLVLSDLQGIMMFLVSTSYGDHVPFDVNCLNSGCGMEDQIDIYLSQLEFKETTHHPQDGRYHFDIEINKEDCNFTIKPLTFKDEIDLKLDADQTKSRRVIDSVESINGIEERKYIFDFIKKMKLKDFKKLRKFVESNQLGVQNIINRKCPVCGHNNTYQLNFGFDLLQLPEKNIENVMEECFIVSHYSEGGLSFIQAMEMPVNDRKWYIQRLSTENEKKKKEQDKEIEKSKKQSSK